jgi:hypothetical protein
VGGTEENRNDNAETLSPLSPQRFAEEEKSTTEDTEGTEKEVVTGPDWRRLR